MYVCLLFPSPLRVRALRLTVCGHQCVSSTIVSTVCRISCTECLENERALRHHRLIMDWPMPDPRRPSSPRFRIDTGYSSNASQYQLGKKRIDRLSRCARAKAPSLVVPSLQTRVKHRSITNSRRVDPEIASIHYTGRDLLQRERDFAAAFADPSWAILVAVARGCWSCLLLGEASRRVSSPTCVCFVAVWGCTGFV